MARGVNMKLESKKAFTLIELVMVIVILGILAASAIPKFTNLSGKAHDATVQGIVGAVKGGILIVKSDNMITGTNASISYYPESLDGRSAQTTVDSLFFRVLDQSPEADWIKTAGPSTAGGTATETYDYTGKGTGLYVELTYTNNLGTFVITQQAH